MKTHRWEDIKREKLTPEEIAANRQWAEEQTLEMNLQALRTSLGVSQEELARRLEISQPQLSRAERGEDHLLSTLRRYVEALGGTLAVRAVFADKQVDLRGV